MLGEPGCWDLSRSFVHSGSQMYFLADAAGPLCPDARRIVIVLKKPHTTNIDLKKVRLWDGVRFDLKAS